MSVSGVHPRSVLQADDIRALFADVYLQAVQAALPMVPATQALESIRNALETRDSYAGLDEIDTQIGKESESRLRQMLVELRERVERAIADSLLARIHNLAQDGFERALTQWITSYVTALNEWRAPVCSKLAEDDLLFLRDRQPSQGELRAWTRAMSREKWIEALPLYEWASQQPTVPIEERAKAIVTVAEIHTYRLSRQEDGLRHLQEALAMAPGLFCAVVAMAKYYYRVSHDDAGAARTWLARAIEIDANSAAPLIVLGDIARREGDIDAASAHYEEAISREPGKSECYKGLIRALVSGGSRATDSRVHELLERMILVDPAGEPARYLEYLWCSSVLSEAGRLDEALEWAERARVLQPTWSDAYTASGFLHFNAGRLEEAVEAFEEARTLEPDFDAVLGLALTYQERGDWSKALEVYRQGADIRPMMSGVIMARMGQALVHLGRYNEAAKMLLSSLRTGAGSDKQTALDALEDVVNHRFLEEDRPDAAIALLEEIKSVVGPTFDADYHNLVGNIRFYLGDYPKAAGEYQAAVDLRPTDPVLYSNLAQALGQAATLASTERAIAALETAIRLDPANDGYQIRLTEQRRRSTVSRSLGEDVLKYQPIATPIAVSVSEDLVPLVARPNRRGLTPELWSLIEAIRTRVRSTLGVRLPGIRFRAEPGSARYEIFLSGLSVAVGAVLPGHVLVPHSSLTVIEGEAGSEVVSDPRTGAPATWVPKAAAPESVSGGMPLEVLMGHIELLLRRHLARFLTDDEVWSLVAGAHVTGVDLENPAVIRRLTLVLQELAAERVPITEIDAIIRCVCQPAVNRGDLLQLVDQIRLLKEVRPRLPGNDASSLRALSAHTESLIREQLRHQSLPSGIGRGAFDEIINAIGPIEAGVAIVVDDTAIRAFTRRILERVQPDVAVIARRELLPAARARLAPDTNRGSERRTEES